LLFSFNKIDPPKAYLNLSRASWPNGFRHFGHFAILGISLDNLIFKQKDLATKCKK